MQFGKWRRPKDSTGDDASLLAKDASTSHLRLICLVLVLLVCIQFAYIAKLSLEDTRQITSPEENVQERFSESDKNHRISKRQIGRGLAVCPPGCVRRRKKKGPFGAMGRPEFTVQPPAVERDDWYGGESGPAGPSGDRGIHGSVGESGSPGMPGSQGAPGARGLSGAMGSPGSPGTMGSPGSPGAMGSPGSPGAMGSPGSPGAMGSPGYPGAMGSPGSPGAMGSPGSPGAMGSPGSPGAMGSPGGRGSPGSSGAIGSPGSPGRMGSLGASGSLGQRGHPGSSGYHGAQGPSGRPGYGYNYDAYPYNNGVSLRSGSHRGDIGQPTEDTYARRNESASELLKEFRLYPHPECKDEVDHRALMDTLKDKGQVTFMILIDLKDNEYCIVHS